MRELIESLAPGERPISLKLIGSIFAFYVLAMTTAAVMVAGQQSRANLRTKRARLWQPARDSMRRKRARWLSAASSL